MLAISSFTRLSWAPVVVVVVNHAAVRECLSELTFLLFLLRGSATHLDDSSGCRFHLWTGWCGDEASAFLQGKQPDWEQHCQLYTLIQRTGNWTAKLYRVRGIIYRLPNAPHRWTEEVVARLEDIKPKLHSFDRMVFYKRRDPEELTSPSMSVVMVYEDAFIGLTMGKKGSIHNFEENKPEEWRRVWAEESEVVFDLWSWARKVEER